MRRFVLLLILLLQGLFAADQLFVSPDGTSTAAGTSEQPLDLASGLARLRPGVTLWLRQGTYTTANGIWIDRGGTASSPAVVRSFAGERVQIVGGDGQAVITVVAPHVWLWGLEIYSAAPLRISGEPGAFPSDIRRMTAVATAQTPGAGVGLHLINCIVHDGFNGVALWNDAEDAELYGNLIFNNGWEGADKGWNHGIYTQNSHGTKRIVDNIIFNQFSHGIHAYGSEKASLDNFYLEGNVVFNNGELSAREGYARNILIGGARTALNPTLVDNFTYYPVAARDGSNNIGYESGCENLRATGNHFVGPVALRLNCRDGVMQDNTFYGDITGFRAAAYPQNRYLSGRPDETWVFVRPNRYQPGRGHIIIYNWQRSPAVTVDIGPVVSRGSVWILRDAQNILGPPITFGLYMGGAISVPMTSQAVTQPVGEVPLAPKHTDREFGVFVIETLGAYSLMRGADKEPSLSVRPVNSRSTAERTRGR